MPLVEATTATALLPKLCYVNAVQCDLKSNRREGVEQKDLVKGLLFILRIGSQIH